MMGGVLESNNIISVLVIILKCLPQKATTNINQLKRTVTLGKSNPHEADGNS